MKTRIITKEPKQIKNNEISISLKYIKYIFRSNIDEPVN